MDDTLRLIQTLYDEDVDDPDLARRVAEDDALRGEYERHRQTKAALDRRSSPSPDPAVVDRVVDHAATAARESPPDSSSEAAAPARAAPDRPARTPSRTQTRRLQGASAVLAVMLLLGLGWWQLRPSGAGAPGASAPEATASDASPQQVEASSPGGAQTSSDDIPEWDDRQEVVRLHRRVEMLRSRSRSDTWGTDLQTVNR